MFSIAFAIHVTAAALLSIHVVVNSRTPLWLPVLILVPLVGSAIYFLAIVLPELWFERRVRRVVAARRHTAPAPAPWETAQRAFEEVPSVHNRLHLAAALFAADAVEQAAEHYEACLAGPFADDPDIRLGAAQAWLRCGRPDKALALLSAAREQAPGYHPAQVTLLMDEARDLTGRTAGARCECTASRSFDGVRPEAA